MAAIETREDRVSGTWTRAEAEALAEAADVGVRAAARRGALQRPVTSEHAVTLLRKAITEASRGRTAPVTLSWTRPEAAALAARAREGAGLGEEFGLIDAPELASCALAALDAFIADTELLPAAAPQPPRRSKSRASREPASRAAAEPTRSRERRSRT